MHSRPPNGTAQTIEAAILQCLADNNVDVTRLRGFGSDGASVMTGRVSGVPTRLKNHSPRMIFVHCVNHRLALAAAHASDGIPYLQRFSKHYFTSTTIVLFAWLAYIPFKKFSMIPASSASRLKMSVISHMAWQSRQ